MEKNFQEESKNTPVNRNPQLQKDHCKNKTVEGIMLQRYFCGKVVPERKLQKVVTDKIES